MDREARIRAWKQIQVMRFPVAALKAAAAKGIMDTYNQTIYVTRLSNEIRNLRDNLREPKITWTSPRQREIDEIVEKVTLLVGGENPRTTITVNIGSEHKGDKQKGTGKKFHDITVCVGHMWLRKVYDNFYRKDFLRLLVNDSWLILKADRLKINDKHVILYEGIGWNRGTNETRRIYIGKNKVDGKADIKFTAVSAVQAAHALASRAIDKQLKLEGETNDGS